MRVCSKPDCDRQHKGRGLCQIHYDAEWRGRAERSCDKPDCNRPHRARGMCKVHYEAWRTGENPTRCSVRGCFRGVRSRNLCNAHYMRWKRNGTVNARRPITGKPACGTYAGAMQHMKRNTPLCPPCLRARREYHREYMRRRTGVKQPRADTRIYIHETVLDVLETRYPDRLTTPVLMSLVQDLHPEWTVDGIRRAMEKLLKEGRVRRFTPDRTGIRPEEEPAEWQALAASWETAS